MSRRHGSGSRGRKWGPPEGSSKEINELALLLRSWLTSTGNTLNSFRQQLTPLHFHAGTVPSLGTLSERFKGKKLDWEFTQTVADVCFHDHTGMTAALFEAEELWKRHCQNPTPVDIDGARAVARSHAHVTRKQQETLKVQHELIDAQNLLLDARQNELELSRYTFTLQKQLIVAQNSLIDSQKAEANSYQLVLLLLQIIHSLTTSMFVFKRDAERSQLSDSEKGSLQYLLDQAATRRDRAIAEKEAAEEEQRAALKGITQAQEEVNALQYELNTLGIQQDETASTRGLLSVPVQGRQVVEQGPSYIEDIDRALSTARRVNQESEELTKRAFAGLQSIEPPQPALSSLVTTGGQVATKILMLRLEGLDREAGTLVADASRKLDVPGLVTLLQQFREAGAPADRRLALRTVCRRRSTREMIELISRCRAAGQHPDVVSALSVMSAHSPAQTLPAIAGSLRAAGLKAEALMFLDEVGHVRNDFIDVLARFEKAGQAKDCGPIYDGACRRGHREILDLFSELKGEARNRLLLAMARRISARSVPATVTEMRARRLQRNADRLLELIGQHRGSWLLPPVLKALRGAKLGREALRTLDAARSRKDGSKDALLLALAHFNMMEDHKRLQR
ncbi:hypothetical protein AS594_32560 [Streptomyces agglomeratus]|uniref:Uncharacterized protein n=1 Tax=Streptomyces agglomeratus TaxID=285458 RepID=A0A1E5PG67_9ACTN|nr:hypothetical protein [Streptomyces agglomeratus]OEJ28511.1 hypothetical protein AS594_32560 [Streptomyces agglomeratus]